MDISLNVLSLLKVISRISYYRLTEHRNANVARNYGILYTREEVINHYRKAVTHYEYLLPFYDYLLILKPQNYVQSWILKMKYVWKVLMIRIEWVFRLILSPLVPAPNRRTWKKQIISHTSGMLFSSSNRQHLINCSKTIVHLRYN